MRFTQQFIVNGKYLGAAPRTFVPVHETLAPPSSYAYFCPVCADLWARCPVTDTITNSMEKFQVWTVPCEKHQHNSHHHIPGSLFLVWDKTFNESFPEDVLRYELNQALKLYKDVP